MVTYCYNGVKHMLNGLMGLLYSPLPRLLATAVFLSYCTINVMGQDEDGSLNNTKIDGYKGIWFTLGQFYEYGDKYAGGLGTYTAKHIPMAVYAPEVGRTFFVYGGTTAKDEKHLLCMVSYFDHNAGLVPKPTVVHDKENVNDPHDNPSLMIDRDGYIWVFVSGRSTKRKGFKYKSTKPYSIDRFKRITREEMTYPQPWLMPDGSVFHFFTKYSGRRELYYETSKNGFKWSDDRKLAGIKNENDRFAGHYQVSNNQGKVVGTFFSRHPNGNVDKRTNLYYLQSEDMGGTWINAEGVKVAVPVTNPSNPGLVKNYQKEGKNVYLKDMGFDHNGHPLCLYLISNGHEPGPKNAPYQWMIATFNGKKWDHYQVCTSDHNYDMGSLFIGKKKWHVVAPAIDGPQKYAGGGEVGIWVSNNQGKTWEKSLQLTNGSNRNHNYMRRPVNGKPPFMFFWADGNPSKMSESVLYFGNLEGDVWKLPYHMEPETAKPQKLDKNN